MIKTVVVENVIIALQLCLVVYCAAKLIYMRLSSFGYVFYWVILIMSLYMSLHNITPLNVQTYPKNHLWVVGL